MSAPTGSLRRARGVPRRASSVVSGASSIAGPGGATVGGRERDAGGNELPAERGDAQGPLDRLRGRCRLERGVGGATVGPPPRRRRRPRPDAVATSMNAGSTPGAG